MGAQDIGHFPLNSVILQNTVELLPLAAKSQAKCACVHGMQGPDLLGGPMEDTSGQAHTPGITSERYS